MTYDIDELLGSSAPAADESSGIADALADLVLGARRMAVLAAARRRRRRTVVAGTASAALVALGATAAAAVGGWTAPWAAHPLTSITYTLPSGGTCEQRIGNLRIADPTAQQDIQQWLGQHQLSQIADVNAALQQLRSGPSDWITPAGRSVPVGYGTSHYDPDYEYDTAVWQALEAAVHAKLEDDGFHDYLDVTWAVETHCTGANPTPEVPSWEK